eukprot:gene5251-10505_t
MKIGLQFLLWRLTISSLIPNPQNENNDINQQTVSAVDSDYLSIEKRPSQLPISTAGDGVYAKVLLLKGSIICEYRGPIIADKDFLSLAKNDKMFSIIGPDNEKYHIVGENICAYINDCTASLDRVYSNTEVETIESSDTSGSSGVSCFPGYSYNAVALSHNQSGKLFIVADRDILPGEEIFYPYGWAYWKRRIIENSMATIP